MKITGKILGRKEEVGPTYAQIGIVTEDGIKLKISIHQRYLLDIQKEHKIGDVINLDVEEWQMSKMKESEIWIDK